MSAIIVPSRLDNGVPVSDSVTSKYFTFTFVSFNLYTYLTFISSVLSIVPLGFPSILTSSYFGFPKSELVVYCESMSNVCSSLDLISSVLPSDFSRIYFVITFAFFFT